MTSMQLQWIRVGNYEAMSSAAAARIAAAIEGRLRAHQPALVGLATGNTMLQVYVRLAAMINQLGLPLARLHTFNLDEYVGADGRAVPIDHPLSYRAYMQENFFSRLDPRLGMNPAHMHFPDPTSPAAFDALFNQGGLDIQLLGIGFNGHIAFNEPIAETEISVEAFAALPTRVVNLTELTIQTNARLTAGGDRAKVLHQAVSMGMKPILGLFPRAARAAVADQARTGDARDPGQLPVGPPERHDPLRRRPCEPGRGGTLTCPAPC